MLTFLLGAEQKQAVEETKAVFGPLRERIAGAVEKLERLLVGSPSLSLFHLLLQRLFYGSFLGGEERGECVL